MLLVVLRLKFYNIKRFLEDGGAGVILLGFRTIKMHMIICLKFMQKKKKEIYWRQRAKQFWLKVGDKNTRFFHAWANKRWKRNSILRLRNDQGDW